MDKRAKKVGGVLLKIQEAFARKNNERKSLRKGDKSHFFQ